jgi:hypothetical protein
MQDGIQKPFQWRAFVTFYVVISFIVISLTGIVLFITPPGRIANWSGWRLMGFSKEQWQTVHTIFAFLFVIAASFHLFFNWKVVVSYLTRRFKEGLSKRRELIASLTISVIVLVMSADGAPPFGTLMSWGDDLKNSWSTPANAPPVPHAELLTVEKFAGALNMPLDQLISRLSAAGLMPDSAGMLVADLGRKYAMTPGQIYERAGLSGVRTRTGEGGGGGYGRKTVAIVCTDIGITVEEGVRRLRANGIAAETSSSVRILAQENGMTPLDIVDVLKGTTQRENP